MNIFKGKILKWWQVSILKLSLLSIGIAIGAQWNNFFAPYIALLAIIGVLLGIYIASIWLRQE